MDLDTRARRAADGVRGSVQGVDPMAQITELKHEGALRRRASRAAGVLGAVVVVAGAGWLAVSQLGGSDGATPQPMSSPSAVDTTPTPEASPGPIVGAGLRRPLTANAPSDWKVFSDDGSVWIDADKEAGGASIHIDGPIGRVWDPTLDRGVSLLPNGYLPNPGSGYSGYAGWLQQHPSLHLISERTVTVDGRPATQLTMRVDPNAPGAPGYDGVLLAEFVRLDTDAWDEVEQGTVFIETVIELAWGNAGTATMVVKASGGETDAERAELEAALDLVLSTMELPQ